MEKIYESEKCLKISEIKHFTLFQWELKKGYSQVCFILNDSNKS